MSVIPLKTDSSEYEIHIGRGLLGLADTFAGVIRSRQVFIITNETVAARYLPAVQAALTGFEVDHYCIGDGESYKNLTTLGEIVGEMLARKHNRQTTIIALGGGVVGDTAGFAAATYQRGVNFIQVPTTLLAQVDSSVGGKTAVNHPLGKNMIGAFYQPRRVIIDIDTLATLPPRELAAGFAEIIKHGVLADWHYFEWLETNVDELRALSPELMTRAIQGSCEIKAGVVSKDEKEAGVRALLNLGHTFGHAIEAAQGYGQWLHGEAVGAGLVMAADLSMRLGMIRPDIAARIKQLVGQFDLPVAPPENMTVDAFMTHMAVDKKATDQGVRFVLIDQPGAAKVVDNVEFDVLQETLLAGASLCAN